MTSKNRSNIRVYGNVDASAVHGLRNDQIEAAISAMVKKAMEQRPHREIIIHVFPWDEAYGDVLPEASVECRVGKTIRRFKVVRNSDDAPTTEG